MFRGTRTRVDDTNLRRAYLKYYQTKNLQRFGLALTLLQYQRVRHLQNTRRLAFQLAGNFDLAHPKYRIAFTIYPYHPLIMFCRSKTQRSNLIILSTERRFRASANFTRYKRRHPSAIIDVQINASQFFRIVGINSRQYHNAVYFML